MEGHGLNSCEVINDLVTRGSLARDEMRRITLPNGQRLLRIGEETFKQAYDRSTAASATNLVRFITHEDGEDLDLQILEMEEEQLVAAAEHSPKATRGQRKGIFEGVVIPPRPQAKGKENQAPASLQAPKEPPTLKQASRKSAIRDQAPKNAPIGASSSQSASLPTPIPIEVHPYLFDASDDAIMEDLPHQTIKSSTQDPNDKRKVKPIGPLASSLAQNSNPRAIVDCILDTPLTLSVGEVIGTSKEVSLQLQDLIRIRRQPLHPIRSIQGTPPDASLMCLTSSPFITINLHCNGELINAVIDSGSTLNVVKESVANSIIRLPINRKLTTKMRDSNGGQGRLTGMISEVPLFCGAAKTWANVFVSPDNDSGFELLLGRPWMQGNSISIIEKESGTYIIFGADPEIPLEMCAQKGASPFGTGFLITQEPGSDSEDSSGSLSQPTSSSASPSMSHSPIYSPRPIYPFLGYSGRPEDSMDPREFILSQTVAPLHPELEARLPTQPFSFPPHLSTSQWIQCEKNDPLRLSPPP